MRKNRPRELKRLVRVHIPRKWQDIQIYFSTTRLQSLLSLQRERQEGRGREIVHTVSMWVMMTLVPVSSRGVCVPCVPGCVCSLVCPSTSQLPTYIPLSCRLPPPPPIYYLFIHPSIHHPSIYCLYIQLLANLPSIHSLSIYHLWPVFSVGSHVCWDAPQDVCVHSCTSECAW